LGDQGVASIVDAILENEASAVSTLDVGDCGLSDKGATQIARLLESNNTVTDLNISANNITRKGWQAISEALEKNTKLRALSLDYNQITDEDLSVLADGFRRCTSLRSVDLEANRIRDDGGRILLDVLRENEKIIDLTLMPMNTIEQGILDEIKDILDNRIRSRPSSANSEDTSSN
jgi:Ran GTPase-activating protein (RanGAP) involved in mRNA processing and transport